MVVQTEPISFPNAIEARAYFRITLAVDYLEWIDMIKASYKFTILY